MGVVLENIVDACSSANADKREQVRGCDHSPFVFFVRAVLNQSIDGNRKESG